MNNVGVVVLYLLKFHFIADHRRIVGSACLLLSVMSFGLTHLGQADPLLDQYAKWLAGFGTYLLAVGIALRDDPAKKSQPHF